MYYVVVCAHNDSDYSKDFLPILSRYTELMPTSESNLISWDTLPTARYVGQVVAAPNDAWETLRSASWFTDEIVLKVWSVRSPDDLGIRRSRLNDTYMAYKFYYNSDTQFWSRALRTQCFDVITAINLLNYALITERVFDIFGYLEKIGALECDVEWFTARTKTVSDLLKRSIVTGFSKEFAIECACLTGYRNPPFPGFDVFTQARELAQSGNIHTFGTFGDINNFATFTDKSCDGVVSQVPWLSFEEYVASGLWSTSGASSEGVVEWSYGGNHDHFKAKKNLAFAVCDVGKLAADARAAVAQYNKVFPKAELGKIRIAVSSDMPIYLVMSYLCYLTGDFDKTCSIMIGRESINEQTNRMYKTLCYLVGRFGFPFDAAQYDHQPETEEVKDCVRSDLSHATLNTPLESLQHTQLLINNLIHTFNAAHIITTSQGRTESVLMTGGVASGWRITSRLGNTWSKSQYLRALAVLEKCGFKLNVQAYIKGDDMQFTLNTHAAALLLRWAIASVNLIGNDSKFGILPGYSELLRIAYYPGRCVGYAARAAPGLQQSKPWSSEQMDQAAEVRSIQNICAILRRRGCNVLAVDCFEKAAYACWSRLQHTTMSWLSVPQSLGGLGVCPWRGTVYSSSKLQPLNFDGILITNTTTAYSQHISKPYIDYNLTADELSQLVQIKTRATLSADDVPQVRRALRADYSWPTFSPVRVEMRWTFPALVRLRQACAYLASLIPAVDVIANAESHFPPHKYASYRHLHQAWLIAADVARLRGGSIADHLIPAQPDFVYDLVSIERRGLSRHEALDYLFGTTPLAPLTRLHPALTSVLHNATIFVANGFLQSQRLHSPEFTSIVNQTSQVLEIQLDNSELCHTLFHW